MTKSWSSGAGDAHVDDRDTVFADVPRIPKWFLVVDVLILAMVLPPTWLVATHLAASRGWAVAATVLVALTVGGKFSLFGRFRRIPRLSPTEFDETRAAADRALAVFRAAHRDLPHVRWSLLARRDEGSLLALYGGKTQPFVDATAHYLVPRAGPPREVQAARHLETGYSQAISRPGS